MRKDTDAYLKHILDAIERIRRHLKKSSTLEEFERDEKTMDAVLHQLQIIGEAAKRVKQETKNELSEIPWKDITGTRNVIVHDYFQIEAKIMWDTATKDLDSLFEAITNYLKK